MALCFLAKSWKRFVHAEPGGKSEKGTGGARGGAESLDRKPQWTKKAGRLGESQERGSSAAIVVNSLKEKRVEKGFIIIRTKSYGGPPR